MLWPISALCLGFNRMAEIVTGSLAEILTASADSLSELVLRTVLLQIAYKNHIFANAILNLR
jgi:hypothetical protein